ncbi:MAG: hypothetical protein U1F57_00675 [bacterium]
MRRLKLFAMISMFSLLAVSGISGCGNGTTQEIGVFTDPFCVRLPLGGTQSFCAQVTNTNNLGTQWTILGGDNNGSFVNPTQSPTVTTSPNDVTPVTYQAPAVLPSSCVVTIQVASAEDPVSSNQISILLGSPSTCPNPPGPAPNNCITPRAPICPPPAP